MQPVDAAPTAPLLWNKKGVFATDAFAAYGHQLVREMEIDHETVIVALTMAATGIAKTDISTYIDIVGFMEDRTRRSRNGRVDTELESCRRALDGRAMDDAEGPELSFWSYPTAPVSEALKTFAFRLMQTHDIDLKTAAESLIRAATRLANERGPQTWINFLGLMDGRARRLGAGLDQIAAELERDEQDAREKKPA